LLLLLLLLLRLLRLLLTLRRHTLAGRSYGFLVGKRNGAFPRAQFGHPLFGADRLLN
jgi:hypothetical protein